jgi:hypothetical protein
LEECNAFSICNFVPPYNNIFALPEPSIIFEVPDIVLIVVSRFTKEEKCFLSLRIVWVVALSTRHYLSLLLLVSKLILKK